MASLRKKARSPYWWGCFTLPDGTRSQRSTRQIKRKEAQKLADEWEKLSKSNAGARQAQKVINEIHRVAHGVDIPMSTAGGYIEAWISRREREVKPATFNAYKGRASSFLTFLGSAAKEPLGNVTPQMLQRYRDEVASTRTVATANQGVKILRIIFEDVRRDGYLTENIAKDVRPWKDAEVTASRRPFTLPELKVVLSVADDEWRSMIFFGIYTGQRLADLARITWANLDLETNVLRIVTAKTGRTVIVPLCAPLCEHILTLPAGDNPAAPVHPRCRQHLYVGGRAATISRQFGEILAAAGLREATSHKAQEGKQGRSAKRTPNALSFHSLRHTATSEERGHFRQHRARHHRP